MLFRFFAFSSFSSVLWFDHEKGLQKDKVTQKGIILQSTLFLNSLK